MQVIPKPDTVLLPISARTDMLDRTHLFGLALAISADCTMVLCVSSIDPTESQRTLVWGLEFFRIKTIRSRPIEVPASLSTAVPPTTDQQEPISIPSSVLERRLMLQAQTSTHVTAIPRGGPVDQVDVKLRRERDLLVSHHSLQRILNEG